MIKEVMSSRTEEAIIRYKRASNIRDKCLKSVKSKYGSISLTTRKMISEANRAARKTRMKIEKRQTKKILYMKDKHMSHINTTFMLPSDLSDYSKMKIFQSQDDLTTKKLELEGEPMVIGCEATEDENKVLLLPPKFATMEKMDVNKHKLEL